MKRKSLFALSQVIASGYPFPRCSCLMGAGFAAIAILASQAQAATATWSGNTSSDLSNGLNWSTTPAAPASGDSWGFGAAGTSGTSLNNGLAVGYAVASISFDGSTASNYAITGNAITLGVGTNKGTITIGTTAINHSESVGFDIALGYNGELDVSQGSTLTVSGVISGAKSITVNNASGYMGTVKLGNSNTFTGGFSLINGTLFIGSIGNNASTSSSLGAGSKLITLGSINLTSAVTLNYTGIGETSNRALTLGNSVNINNNGTGAIVLTGAISSNFAAGASKTLTLGGSNTTSVNEIQSVLSNKSATELLSVTKTGANNTWVLSGNNTYTGATTVTAGTLLINGNSSSATGAVAVNAGGALGGNGIIGGDVTVANSATAILTPGTSTDSTETLSLNSKNLTFSGANSQLLLDIAGTDAGSFDKIAGVNTLSENGAVTFTLAGIYTAASWDVLDFTSKTGNFSSVTLVGSYVGSLTRSADLWTGEVGGSDWSFDQSTGVLSVVPEPATWAMILGGLGMMVFMQRAHRRNA